MGKTLITIRMPNEQRYVFANYIAILAFKIPISIPDVIPKTYRQGLLYEIDIFPFAIYINNCHDALPACIKNIR